MEETRQSFQERLVQLSQKDRMLIDLAYDIAKESHRTQLRDTGERYFEHLRAVTLILIDECKLHETDLIISSLLHDTVEDSGIFGNATQPYSLWKEVVSFRIERIFNANVASIVIALTKPKIDGKEIKTRDEAVALYIENLKKADAAVILLKMCDRLHNLRSLPGTAPEKHRRILTDTETKYYPLFEKALLLPDYQNERRKLFEEIKITVTKLKQHYDQ